MSVWARLAGKFDRRRRDLRSEDESEAPEPPKKGLVARSQLSHAQLERLLDAELVNLTELTRMAWNGVPVRRRTTVWMLLLGYLPTNKSRRVATLARKRREYADAVTQHFDIASNARSQSDQTTLRQILVDVPRTTPSVPLFTLERIQSLMVRVLYVWAVRHPASGYVQGMNDLLSIFLIVFIADATRPPECGADGAALDDGAIALATSRADSLSEEQLEEIAADTYWCLTKVLDSIHDHYTHSQPGLQRAALHVDGLLKRVDAELHRHLEGQGIALLQVTFRWINCLLVRELPMRAVVRLWDTCVAEESGFGKFFPYVCAAFLCHFSETIRGLDAEDLHLFLQALPTRDWADDDVETLLSEAYILSTLFRDSPHHLIDNSLPTNPMDDNR
ncbi:rab-GTPase-TBC domain-containing protein [Pelagophyceae sp. CCMP2097]|nr:rab-GTPase-TBC domain-containing protein [Pelagophyceae sp. CCMP2097]